MSDERDRIEITHILFRLPIRFRVDSFVPPGHILVPMTRTTDAEGRYRIADAEFLVAPDSLMAGFTLEATGTLVHPMGSGLPVADVDLTYQCERAGCAVPIMGGKPSECAACHGHYCDAHLYYRTWTDGEPVQLCVDCSGPSDPWGPVS